MNKLYDPRYIIAFGGLCFTVAYIAHLKSGEPIYNWFGKMHWIGQVATVGAFASLGWLIVSTLIKRR